MTAALLAQVLTDSGDGDWAYELPVMYALTERDVTNSILSLISGLRGKVLTTHRNVDAIR